MDAYFNKPFAYSERVNGDFYIRESNLGWQPTDCDAAISVFGRNDPLFFYMESGIDVGFYYGGHKYWIESPSENFRGHGGDVWSLAVCDKPNPDWSGRYLIYQHLGIERHDAEDRTELCYYDGVEEFLEKAKIGGKDLRTVLNESFITDL